MAPDGTVVWRVALDVETTGAMRAVLSDDELARAERFHFPEHRRRFITARAALRTILGELTERTPSELEFAYAERGKPSLAGGPEFNLSHSADAALVAVSTAPIGVDLEAIREDVRCLEIAERFFTPSETAGLRALEGTMQRRRFFDLWTAKEARMKATGEGLSLSPQRLEVAFENGRVKSVAVAGDPPDGAWHLHPIDAGAGFAAALAARDERPPLVRQWLGRCE